jgi:aspartate 1-decarboxylase
LQLRMLKGKIHRARVTGADLNYEGSIEIDASLLDAAGIIPFEQVDIWSITSGDRFSTYALPAPRRSGVIALNGAAARRVQSGDEIIIAAFAFVNEKEASSWKPKVVFVDEKNRVRPLPPLAHGLISD